MSKRKKIIVALSGGIDSAFSAYLAKNWFSWSEITAVFMQNWDNFVAGNKTIKSRCTQTEDWEDARKVASFLDINLERKQFINEYWEEVFTNFLTKLQNGITPNPDILCNSLIKFSHFTSYIKDELNADYLVTGHYARITHDQEKKNYYLAKCKDANKDQTYFLCQINRSILPFLIFPLGEFEKQEVRQQTLELGFPNTQRKESMGICFIGENSFKKFISSYLPEESGNFVDAETKLVVGSHRGTSFYTIGQRRGLALGGKMAPYYVVGKDIARKIIYVAKGVNNPLLYSRWCLVKEINWLIPENEIKLLGNKELTAKFRHRQEETAIRITFEKKNLGTVKVLCEKLTRALTPGQYAVFYRANICLGGGVVFQTERLDEQVRLF